MSSAATAYKYSDLDDDLTPIKQMTVECWRCDPDNPLAVPRKKCQECNGTGRSTPSLIEIVKELHTSHKELNRNDSGTYDECSTL